MCNAECALGTGAQRDPLRVGVAMMQHPRQQHRQSEYSASLPAGAAGSQPAQPSTYVYRTNAAAIVCLPSHNAQNRPASVRPTLQHAPGRQTAAHASSADARATQSFDVPGFLTLHIFKAAAGCRWAFPQCHQLCCAYLTPASLHAVHLQETLRHHLRRLQTARTGPSPQDPAGRAPAPALSGCVGM